MTSIRDLYGKHILQTHQEQLRAQWGVDLPLIQPRPGPMHGAIKIGIVGAGAAGLFAAMLLESLRPHGFDYEILEADKRVGGRLLTHHFKHGLENDYYDVGAMRFPDIPFMKIVFDLIGNNINFFNNKALTNDELDEAYKAGNPDPFNTGILLPGGPGAMTDNVFNRFKIPLADDFKKGWAELMKYDKYTTREYMTSDFPGPGYPDDVVSQLELFSSATSLYDCAFAESIMDSLDFSYPLKPCDPPIEWYCIQGGAERIAEGMYKKLNPSKVHLKKRVTAIEPVWDPANPKGPAELVNVQTKDGTHTYKHVISTLPFGSLRMVDTTQCHFPYRLQSAIRALHYDDAAKVAIQFKTRWWEQPPYNQVGGVSSTDRPTRTVVYPSYGIGKEEGATIIVSYTWAQDALRLGSLVGKEDRLIEGILKDLAVMHGVKDWKLLQEMVVAHHAFNWYHEPKVAGAFALFGPGQFSGVYTEVTKPFGGVVHWAGEATSVHHAWLLGALNSAYRAVVQILKAEGRKDFIKTVLEKEWGRCEELDLKLVEQQVALGQYPEKPMGQ
ncbi:hypothetical protein JAAARDRAFT_154248 [Jaapia argillacea MUCL 33604]|uniref:Amine oxidase domain-containing protein n=1 Tax=Jaapia argillacea MUCL 33604 TaxID=933084 RepID=A0A067Q8V7_9AGAM|nr:hypothetical protein JAAARDRAFT_154248 [Jaapia argillacea MUCL 33604]